MTDPNDDADASWVDRNLPEQPASRQGDDWPDPPCCDGRGCPSC